MEVFKIWLGDYGLVTSEDCLDVEGNRTLFSVRKLNRQGKETALVDCCLTKAEAEAIFEAATLNENPVAKVTK
jgi:hypothetical protein